MDMVAEKGLFVTFFPSNFKDGCKKKRSSRDYLGGKVDLRKGGVER